MLFNPSKSEQRLHPFLESLANLIRLRRSVLPRLIPLELNSDLLDIKGKLDGDDLFIRNEFHRARGIRKVHLEIARIGSGLEILHCVFFPEPTFDIPIFGVDIVSRNESILAAVVDLSPVDKDLPLIIQKKLSDLSLPIFRHVRQLPDWGDIFSNYVQFIRPDGREEEESFLKIVDSYLEILCTTLSLSEPDLLDSALTIGRLNYQKYYCLQQRRNDKTRNVLAKAFSPQWADRYINTLLFEDPTNL